MERTMISITVDEFMAMNFSDWEKYVAYKKFYEDFQIYVETELDIDIDEYWARDDKGREINYFRDDNKYSYKTARKIVKKAKIAPGARIVFMPTLRTDNCFYLDFMIMSDDSAVVFHISDNFFHYEDTCNKVNKSIFNLRKIFETSGYKDFSITGVVIYSSIYTGELDEKLTVSRIKKYSDKDCINAEFGIFTQDKDSDDWWKVMLEYNDVFIGDIDVIIEDVNIKGSSRCDVEVPVLTLQSSMARKLLTFIKAWEDRNIVYSGAPLVSYSLNDANSKVQKIVAVLQKIMPENVQNDPCAGLTTDEIVVKELAKKGMRKGDFYKNSGLNSSLYSKLIKGKRGISRDNAIKMAIGMKLTNEEAMKWLKRFGYAFSESDARDVIILYAMEETGCNLDEINDCLYFMKLEPLIEKKFYKNL